MNTKGIKFLAVLAVLAMAFAVFAVVTENDAVPADREAAGLDEDEALTLSGIKIIPATGTHISDYVGADRTYILAMSGLTVNNTITDADVWGGITGYAFFDVNFSGVDGATAIWMYQKNTALSLTPDFQSNSTKAVAGSQYTERISGWTYAGTFDGDTYAKLQLVWFAALKENVFVGATVVSDSLT